MNRQPPLLTSTLPFVGRDNILQQLRTFWQETDQFPEPRVIVLEAPAGSGKTRLMSELIKTPPEYGVLVQVRLFSECSSPQALIENALRQAFITASMPDPGTFNSWFELSQALDRLARTRITLLVFEDIHTIPEHMIEQIAFLLNMNSATRLSVICTTRPIDQTDLASLQRYVVQQTPLNRLDRFHVQSLWKATFSCQAPSDLVNMMAERSHGNPMALTRMFRRLIETGFLQRKNDSEGWQVYGSLKEGLFCIKNETDLLGEGMLRGLAPELRKTAEWIAAHGEVVPVDWCQQHLAPHEIEELLAEQIILERQALMEGRTMYEFSHPLIHEQLLYNATRGIDALVKFIATEKKLISYTPFRYIAHHGSGNASSTYVSKALKKGIQQMWNNTDQIEQWHVQHQIGKGAHRLLEALNGMPEYGPLRLLLLRTETMQELSELEFHFDLNATQMLPLLLKETEHYTTPETAIRRLEALSMAVVAPKRIHLRLDEILDEWEEISNCWPAIVDTDEYSIALFMLLRHSTRLRDRAYGYRLLSMCQHYSLTDSISRGRARSRQTMFLFSQIGYPSDRTDKEQCYWYTDLWKQIKQILNSNTAIDIKPYRYLVFALITHIGYFHQLHILIKHQETETGSERLLIQRFLNKTAILFGDSLFDRIAVYQTLLLKTAGMINQPDIIAHSYYLCAYTLLRFDEEQGIAYYLKELEPVLQHDLIDQLARKQAAGLPFALPLTKNMRRLLEGYRNETLRNAPCFNAPKFNRLIDAWLGDTVPANDIIVILKEILTQPVYLITNVWGAISALWMINKKTSQLSSEVLNTDYTSEISIAVTNLLHWFSERELFLSVQNLLKRYNTYLSKEEKQSWFNTAHQQQCAFEEHEELHGRGTSPEPTHLSMIGTISIQTEGQEQRDVSGQRMRIMLGLIVAHHMVHPSIGYNEFVRVAAGEHDDPKYVRNYTKKLLTRVIQQFGETLLEDSDIPPTLNRKTVYVNLLEAWDLIKEANQAVIRSESLLAYRKLFRALNIVQTDIVFPELYDSFFEEMRDMFDGKLRATIFSVTHLLSKENDYEKEVEIVTMARKRFLGDEEIEERRRRVQELLGKKSQEERVEVTQLA